MNNFRFHPFNHIINHLLAIVPPLLLGFSAEAILGYTALALPVLLLQHANVDFRFGWLNAIVNTNEVHRWHHSSAKGEENFNFGRALVIWDQVFGTFHFPKPKISPANIGLLDDNGRFPDRYLAQLLYPFTRQCCR